MEKEIVIRYSQCEEGVHCDVEATQPVDASEILFGLSSVISLYSQNVGIHPIQVASALQQMIVEETFNNIKKMTDKMQKDAKENEDNPVDKSVEEPVHEKPIDDKLVN